MIFARKRFRLDVDRHIVEARATFTISGYHPENDCISLADWTVITGEEWGKFLRCVNKLAIAEDADVRRQWTDEGYHRLVTTVAMLTRLAEAWPEVAAHRTYKRPAPVEEDRNA